MGAYFDVLKRIDEHGGQMAGHELLNCFVGNDLNAHAEALRHLIRKGHVSGSEDDTVFLTDAGLDALRAEYRMEEERKRNEQAVKRANQEAASNRVKLIIDIVVAVVTIFGIIYGLFFN